MEQPGVKAPDHCVLVGSLYFLKERSIFGPDVRVVNEVVAQNANSACNKDKHKSDNPDHSARQHRIRLTRLKALSLWSLSQIRLSPLPRRSWCQAA